MYTPPSRHTRCFFTAWTYPNKEGGPWLYVAAEAIGEFFARPKEEVISALSAIGGINLPKAQVPKFVEGIHRLFSHQSAATTLEAST